MLSCDPCGAVRCCGADGNITLALNPCKIQGICLSQKQLLRSREYMYLFFLNSSRLILGKLSSLRVV